MGTEALLWSGEWEQMSSIRRLFWGWREHRKFADKIDRILAKRTEAMLDEWNSYPFSRSEIDSVLSCMKRWKNLTPPLLLPQDSFFLFCCDGYAENAEFDFDIFNDICDILNPALLEAQSLLTRSLITDGSLPVIDTAPYKNLTLGEALIAIGAAKPE